MPVVVVLEVAVVLLVVAMRARQPVRRIGRRRRYRIPLSRPRLVCARLVRRRGGGSPVCGARRDRPRQQAHVEGVLGPQVVLDAAEQPSLVGGRRGAGPVPSTGVVGPAVGVVVVVRGPGRVAVARGAIVAAAGL